MSHVHLRTSFIEHHRQAQLDQDIAAALSHYAITWLRTAMPR